jgi:TP901 family phage tail tape measure protein
VSDENDDVNVELKGDSRSFVRAFNEGATAAKNVSQAIGFVHGQLDKLGSKIDSIAKKGIHIGAGLALGNTAQIGASVLQLTKLESAMANVSTVADTSVMSLGDMQKQIIDLSTHVPQTATTLAEGLYDIASSGFQGSDAMKILNVSAKAASAGLTDTQTAAAGVVAVLNAYGMSADQAGMVSDTLFQTVNVGVLNFQDLVATVGDWAAMASTLSVPLGDATAALAAMTKQGTNAQMSSTQLTTIMRGFIAPSDGMKKAVGQLGYASAEAMVKQIGLNAAIKAVVGTTDGSAQSIQQLFQDVQGLNGVLQLTGNGAKDYADFLGIMTNQSKIAGSTQEALDKQNKSLAQQWQLLRNDMSAFGMSVAKYLIPPLKLLVTTGTSVLNFLNGMPGPLKAVIGTLGLTSGALLIGGGAFVMYAGKIAIALKALGFLSEATGFPKGKTITEWLAQNIKALSSWIKQLVMGNSAVKDFRKNLLMQGAQALAATAGIAALTVTIYGLVNSYRDAKKASHDYAESLRNDINMNDVNQLMGVYNDLLERRNQLIQQDKSNGGGGGWRGALRAIPEVPKQIVDASGLDSVVGHDIKDSVLDTRGAIEGLNDELGLTEQQIGRLSQNVNILSKGFGLTNEDAIKLADTLNLDLSNVDLSNSLAGGDLDTLTDGFNYNGEAATKADKAVVEYMRSIKDAPNSVKKLNQDVEDFNSTLASGTDRLDAYGKILDKLIGKPLDLREAQSKAAQSLRDLNDVIKDGGVDMNQYSEQGGKMQGAMSDMADAVMTAAQATYEQTGDINQANAVLAQFTQGLAITAKQSGATDQQIAQMIAVMGLTPQNLMTLVQLNGADDALTNLMDINGMMDHLDGRKVEMDVVVKAYLDAPADVAGLIMAPNRDTSTGGGAGGSLGILGGNNVSNTFGNVGRNTPRSSGGGGGGKSPEEVAQDARTEARRYWTALRDVGQINNQDLANLIHSQLDEVDYLSAEYMDIWGEWQDTLKKIDDDKKQAMDDLLASNQRRFNYGDPTMNRQTYVAFLIGELGQVDKYSDEWTKIKDEIARVRQEQDQAAQDAADAEYSTDKNKYAMGGMSKDAYLDFLHKRLMGLKMYSDEWMDTWTEINNVEQDAAEKSLKYAEYQYKNGQISLNQYVQQLTDRLKHTEKFSDEWYSLQDQIAQVQQDAADKIKDKADEVSQAIQDTFNSFTDPIKQANDIIGSFSGQLTVAGSDIKGYYQHVTQGTQQWIDTIKALKNEGLGGSFLRDLIRQGPSSLGFAKAILAMGQEGVSLVNSNESSLANMRNSFGTEMTQAYAPASIGTQLNFGDVTVDMTGLGKDFTESDVRKMIDDGFAKLQTNIEAKIR